MFFFGFSLVSMLQRFNDNPRIFYLKELPFGYNGFIVPSIGVFIKEEHRNSESLRLHELVHWQQFQREGLIVFLLSYAYNHIKYGYDGNPYEVEARFEESDFCKSNYTYCVRNGLAKTVYNPCFRNTYDCDNSNLDDLPIGGYDSYIVL